MAANDVFLLLIEYFNSLAKQGHIKAQFTNSNIKVLPKMGYYPKVYKYLIITLRLNNCFLKNLYLHKWSNLIINFVIIPRQSAILKLVIIGVNLDDLHRI